MLFNCYHKDLILYGKRRPPPKRKFCTVLDFFFVTNIAKSQFFFTILIIFCATISHKLVIYINLHTKKGSNSLLFQ